MNFTNKQYLEMTSKASPKSKILKDCLIAFGSGGAICTIGQLLTNLYVNMGMSLLDARSVTSVTLVAISAILTGFHLYDDIAKFAGAGTLVPITGFANSVVSPAIEFKSEGFILGMGSKMFAIAGPVLVFGITASSIYGLIIWIFHLY